MLRIILLLLLLSGAAFAESGTTSRTTQFENDKVLVWQTIIYPSKNQRLQLHRHDRNRVLVAFNAGVLKVTNDKNQTHYLKFQKDKSYYLNKDVPNELHTDENISGHPLNVLVIELK
jgi:hypothetical protein